jgi:EmrB/QacA subfamily drug resistance transporter
MMAGRILQACGNGVLLSVAQVTILTIYPIEKKGTMMGTYGLATTAAPVIAPTIAGLMIDAFGWKSIFYVVLVVMVISFIMACIVFEDVLELQDKKFDFLSFAESIFAFGGITLGIGNITSYGLFSVSAGVPLLVGIMGSICFIYRQLNSDTPFLDIRILQNRQYRISVISSMLLYFTMMGSSVLMPLYVQTVMGYSAVVSGLVTLPGSLATALVSPFAGRMYDKMGIRKIFIAGSICLVLSNAGMALITLNTPLVVAAVFNVIRNVSIGSLMMPLLTWGTGCVKPEKVADASSLLTSFRTISGSIGSAVFVGIMTAVGSASAASYGDGALMHGLNMAFAAMGLSALVLAALAIRGTARK